MKHAFGAVLGISIVIGLTPGPAQAEILAMMNYESKTEDSIKSLKISGPRQREEGIAVMDVDPESDNFGKILMTIPLPPDLIAHHIFFNKDMSKAYLTALGQSVLHKFDLGRFP